jgi:hypothetical protein
VVFIITPCERALSSAPGVRPFRLGAEPLIAHPCSGTGGELSFSGSRITRRCSIIIRY